MLKSIGHGIYSVETAGRLTHMSAAAERILGWQEDELLGRDMSGVLRLASVEDSSS